MDSAAFPVVESSSHIDGSRRVVRLRSVFLRLSGDFGLALLSRLWHESGLRSFADALYALALLRIFVVLGRGARCAGAESSNNCLGSSALCLAQYEWCVKLPRRENPGREKSQSPCLQSAVTIARAK